MCIFANGAGTQTLCVDSSVLGTRKKAKQSSFLMPGTVISKGKVDGFRSRLRLKPVWVNQENYQNEQLSIFNSDGKGCSLLSIFIAVLGTCSEMKRENNKY